MSIPPSSVAQLLSDCSRLEAGEPLRTALQAAHLVTTENTVQAALAMHLLSSTTSLVTLHMLSL